jgi:hypothetical protein
MIVWWLGCTPADSDTDLAAEPDLAGPVIQALSVSEVSAYGVDIPVDAIFDDPSGIDLGVLVWRQETSVEWHTTPMSVVDHLANAQHTHLRAVIPARHIFSGGIAWYVYGRDASANWNRSCAPAECDDAPFRVNVIGP